VTTYVALLRGINVGGHTGVAMADVRRVFAGLGHAAVQTYLQSGNVVFAAPGTDSSRLAADVEARIARDLGQRVTVLVRASNELARIVAANPFLDRTADGTKLHVTFLADAPDRERAAGLAAPAGESDELALDGREVYLHCPNGYGRTRLNNAYFERRLGVAATTRNWKTVTKLRELVLHRSGDQEVSS